MHDAHEAGLVCMTRLTLEFEVGISCAKLFVQTKIILQRWLRKTTLNLGELPKCKRVYNQQLKNKNKDACKLFICFVLWVISVFAVFT